MEAEKLKKYTIIPTILMLSYFEIFEVCHGGL